MNVKYTIASILLNSEGSFYITSKNQRYPYKVNRDLLIKCNYMAPSPDPPLNCSVSCDVTTSQGSGRATAPSIEESMERMDERIDKNCFVGVLRSHNKARIEKIEKFLEETFNGSIG